MKVRTCVGCGRSLGLRSAVECFCWRSVLEGAVIPHRIRKFRSRVVTLHKAAGLAVSDGEVAAVRIMARNLNRDLEAAV